MKYKQTLILIILLVFIEVFLVAFIYKKLGGFTLLGGDDCSKILCGWGSRNHLKYAFFNDMWLPLHTLILALGLKLMPNTLIISPIINTIFSIGILLILFFLPWELFSISLPVSILTSIFFIFHPFFYYMSLSGLEMPIFHFFILLGVFSWIKYRNSGGRIWLIFASIAFCLSSAIRYEGWIFILIYAFLNICALINKNEKHKKFIVVSLMLACSFIFFWFWWQKVHFGNMLFFVVRQYKQGINEGNIFNQTRMGAFTIFVTALRTIRNFFSIPAILFTVIGVFIAVINRKKVVKDYLIFIIFSFIILLLLFTFKLGGNWIEKQWSVILLLIFPLCSLGLYQGLFSKFIKLLLIPYMLLIFFLLKHVYFGSAQMNYANFSILDNYTKKTALLLNSLKIDSNSKVLLEIRTSSENNNIYLWDSWFIIVIRPDFIIQDRELRYASVGSQDYLVTENNPSIFEQPAQNLLSFFEKNNIRIVIAIYEDTKKKLKNFMEEAASIGHYSIYALPKERYLINSIKSKI